MNNKRLFSLSKNFVILLTLFSCCTNRNTDDIASETSANKLLLNFSILSDDSIGIAKNAKMVGDSLFSEQEFELYNPCDAALSVVYQKLSLKSDKEYLEKLHYLYEATSQEDLDSRKSSSLGISVPNYASLSWGSNKSKVSSLYNKYKTEMDVTLTTHEMIDLNETYTRSEDVQAALDAWSRCIPMTQGIPYLQIQEETDSTVIVFFEMRPTVHHNRNDKVLVKKIIFSDNLSLVDGGEIENRRIKYQGRYTLKFKRSNLNQASILVDLASGDNILPVTIKAIKKVPRLETRTFTNSYTCNVSINVLGKKMTITNPDGSVQVVTFKKQPHRNYQINFNVKTNLKNIDAAVYDYFYSPIKGGLTDFQKKGVKLESDGTLSLDCYLRTGSKKMTGNFTILYGIKTTVCIANCPDEPIE